MRAHKVFEKFEEESDPIYDMRIGAEFWRGLLKNKIVYQELSALCDDSANILRKSFNTSLDNVYFLADDDSSKGDIYTEIEKLLHSSELILTKEYINTYTEKNKEKVIFSLYDTTHGKIGSFFYPDYTDLKTQYMGDLTAAIYFLGKIYK